MLDETSTGWITVGFGYGQPGATAHVNLTKVGTTVLCHIRDSVTLPADNAHNYQATISALSPSQVPDIYRPAYDVFVPAWVLTGGETKVGYFFIGRGGQINFGTLPPDGTFDVSKVNGFLPITVNWSVAP